MTSQPLSPSSPIRDSRPGMVTSGGSGLFWLPMATLWRREMVRFFRQRNRVVGALATPVVFWLLLGSGLNRAFVHAPAVGEHSAAVGYLEYFFPGTVALMVLFTAIFSTFSVIEDRREGFLQGVLVSPASRLAIVLGKVLGGASIAMAQGVLLMALTPWVSHWPGWGMMGAAAGILTLLAVGLTAMGLCIAWPMDSTAGFHAIMNLLLMPMWFLSGAVFPMQEATPWPMKLVMWVNPMTYGQAAFSEALTGGRVGTGVMHQMLPATLITAGFAAAALGLAAVIVGRPSRE